MSEYSTIVVVDRDIYAKIELYRKILEKSEFGTLLKKAKFISDDSAGELSSAELNNAENTFYLYGLICKEKYTECYRQIEENRKTYQNSGYYMIFCCKKYCEPYDMSKSSAESVKKTFAFGIVEDENPQKQTLSGSVDFTESEMDEIRCIKLLSTLMAICPHGDMHKAKIFDSYYTLADVRLSYKHIYLSVLHKLSRYADIIAGLQKNIRLHNDIISELNNKKPVICRGNYSETGLETETLKEFSQYGNMVELRRSLENVYGNSVKSIKGFVRGKINVARLAMAEAEEHCPTAVVQDQNSHSVVDVVTSEETPVYMTLTEVDEKYEIQPERILERPEERVPFDAVRLGAALPVAREFEKRGRLPIGKTILATLAGVLIFAVFVSAVYLARYFNAGFNGVDWYDFAVVVGVPVAAVLCAGLVVVAVQLIQRAHCKNVFKQLHKSLKDFLADAGSWCEAVKKYIDIYLTVFYNNHIKYSRIRKLENEIISLENEIKIFEGQIKPINDKADKIYRLFGGAIEVPENETDRDGRIIKTATRIIEEEITKYAQNAPENIPWLEAFKFGAGNMSGCGGAQ